MWVLFLNDMRASNVENLHPCFRADTKEALLAFLEHEATQGYTEGKWAKAYRKGSPLEWCNPPWNDGPEYIRNAGTREEWMAQAARNYDAQIMTLPVVPKEIAAEGD